MPYIKQKDRDKYKSVIKSVLEIVSETKDCAFFRCDCISYFIWGVVEGFNAPQMYHVDTNPFIDIGDIRAHIDKQIFCTLDILTKNDLPKECGEFNYVVSSILWGFLGDSPLFASANYATRAYMHGVLLRIQERIRRFGLTCKSRRLSYDMMQGVLADILQELYRRKTAVYEDKKIAENGDL